MSNYTLRKCDNCNKEYQADNRNLNRGWGLCCSKACAAKKREKSKPGYNPERVGTNNAKRAGYSDRPLSIHFDDMYGHFSNEDN